MPGMNAISKELAANGKYDLIEQKVDGSRHTYQNGRLFSDRGIDRSDDRFPQIAKELRTLNIHCRGEVAIPDGNVLQLNNSDNWHKAKFHIFDLYSFNGLDFSKAGTVAQRQALEKILSKLNLTNILLPRKFSSFEEGWDFITTNKQEGLVVKTNTNQWKVKQLKEVKLPIIGYEEGSRKGAFIVDWNGIRCRVSGTSEGFVRQCRDLVAKGLVPYAEIEYQFVTEGGHPFQPRLRRINTLDVLTS